MTPCAVLIQSPLTWYYLLYQLYRYNSYKYAILNEWAGFQISSCEVSGNLVVLHTEPGLAPIVAYRIDALRLSGVLGTVAGEDTLLVVVAEGHDSRKVRKDLWKGVQAK